MSPNQKAARFNLTVVVVTLLLFLIAVQLLASYGNRSWIEAAAPASGVFGLLGLLSCARLYYRPVGGRLAMMDERDKFIEERARIIGFTVFWLVWVFGSMLSWALLRYGAGRETIPVDALPLLVLGGFVVFVISQSIAILAQYGRSAHRDES
jgi:hypothetical protein